MRLTVKPLKNRDPGSGMAVIDREALGELGLSGDDFVRIEGRGGTATVARVWPSDASDAGRGIVRIDGQMRRAADVGVDDRVKVEKTEVKPADQVVVALPQNLRIRGNVAPRIKEELQDQAVTAGQTVAFPLGFGTFSSAGRRVPLTVIDTEPSGTVMVRNSTEVAVADRDDETIPVDGLLAVEPSAPAVTYEDIGGLDDELEQVREMVELPMRHPELFQQLGIEPPKGVLLHGPPGTGKTLLAKAVANEADPNFISVKGPELFDKYVGESEKGVRDVFSKARENAPTVVFFDEIDAIASERGRGVGDSNVGERVVSQLLTELDGLEDLEDVVVVAASNRPELIDDALLRPGRLDQHVEVGEPDEAARREIFAVHTRDKPLADDVDLDDLTARTEGYVGADIEAVCREAAATAVREYVAAGADPDEVDEIMLTMDHFDQALEEVGPQSDDEGTAVAPMADGSG